MGKETPGGAPGLGVLSSPDRKRHPTGIGRSEEEIGRGWVGQEAGCPGAGVKLEVLGGALSAEVRSPTICSVTLGKLQPLSGFCP